MSQMRADKVASVVEIFQNCIVYNDKVFASFTDRPNVAETQIHRRPGESFEDQFYVNHPTGLTRTARVQDVIDSKNTWRVE